MCNLKSYIDDFTKNLNEEDRKKANEEGIVNYLPDNVLEEIINDNNSFKEFINNYKLNKHFISMAIELCPDRTEDFAIIIKKYANLFTIENFKAIFKNKEVPRLWINIIGEISDKFSDEIYLYLYNVRCIKWVSPDRMELVIADKLKDKKIEDMSIEEMAALSLIRELTLNETEQILRKVYSMISVESQKKIITILATSQNIPINMVETIIKKFNCEKTDEEWFLNMLSNQNLDTVADYLIEKYKFNNEQISLIKENKKTSKEVIQKLCENVL